MMIESTVAGKLILKRGRSKPIASKLLADIGGTNARFALETGSGNVDAIAVLPCDAYPSLSLAMKAYLSSPAAIAAGAMEVEQAALAIAAPVKGDDVRMTNHHWIISAKNLRREFGFKSVQLINDFKAMALSIPFLSDSDKRRIGGGTATPNGVIALIGPGTGFGVSALIPCGGTWVALETEGGHVNFAPSNAIEDCILDFARQEYPHVSVERLLSGIGLNIVYRALTTMAGTVPETLSTPEIIRRAMTRECEICDETVEAFCAMLGNVAANVALTVGATGGVYIGGGIVPRLGDRFAQSGFRGRFEYKGRFASYMAQIPTFVITAEYPTFRGLCAGFENFKN